MLYLVSDDRLISSTWVSLMYDYLVSVCHILLADCGKQPYFVFPTSFSCQNAIPESYLALMEAHDTVVLTLEPLSGDAILKIAFECLTVWIVLAGSDYIDIIFGLSVFWHRLLHCRTFSHRVFWQNLRVIRWHARNFVMLCEKLTSLLSIKTIGKCDE